MSVGPLGLVGSLANSQAAAKSADVDRAQRDQADHAREVAADIKTERANGIGSADEFSESTDRDADGRQLFGGQRGPAEGEAQDTSTGDAESGSAATKDPHGEAGGTLDLEG